MHVICNVTKVYEYNGFSLYVRYYCGPLCIALDSGYVEPRLMKPSIERCVTFVSSEVFISSSCFIRLDSNLCSVKARDRDRWRDRRNLDLIILRRERKHQGQTRSFCLLVSLRILDSFRLSF